MNRDRLLVLFGVVLGAHLLGRCHLPTLPDLPDAPWPLPPAPKAPAPTPPPPAPEPQPDCPGPYCPRPERVFGFAPAPLPRRAAKADALPADCVVRWNGNPFRTTFGRGGHYEAAGCGVRYVGRWSLCDGVLTITERQAGWDDGEAAWRTYAVRLDGRRGEFVAGLEGPFAIEDPE